MWQGHVKLASHTLQFAPVSHCHAPKKHPAPGPWRLFHSAEVPYDTKKRGTLVWLEFFDDNISCNFCRKMSGCYNASPSWWIFCGFLLDLIRVYTVDTSTGLFLFVIQYIVHTKANRLNHYSLLYTGRGTGIWKENSHSLPSLSTINNFFSKINSNTWVYWLT